MDIRPLEIFDKNPLEVRPVADVVVWEEFKPRPNMFPHADGKILNDEKVIIHPSGSAGELEIFEPNTRVCLLGILGDVGRWLEALWERRSLDASAKGPWSQTIRARTPIVRSATTPGVHLVGSLDGPVRACATCSHRHLMDIIIIPGLTLVVDDAAGVLVWPEAFVHRQPVWSRHWVRLWCSCGLLFHARWL